MSSNPVSSKLNTVTKKSISDSKETKQPFLLSKRQIKYNINSYLIKEYGSNCKNKYKYFYQIIENLLYKKNTHYVSEFKDQIILDITDEYLKKYYDKRESFKKIPQYSKFYILYQLYFCIPTFRTNFFNRKIHQQREKKAGCFYYEHFKENNANSSSENSIDSAKMNKMNKKLNKEKIINLKNRKIKNNKTFFNEEVKLILDKESRSDINNINNINNTLSIHESGSKLKNNRSYLLNTNSNEESLCNIINTLYKKKLFIVKNDTKNNNNNSHKEIPNKNQNKRNLNMNLNSMNNYVKSVLKKRVINYKNNINSVNNQEKSELYDKAKKLDKKVGTKSLTVFVNNKEYEKSFRNKKLVKKIKFGNENNENRELESQNNNYITNKQDNLLTFRGGKIVTRNISYISRHKKKSLSKSKNNISSKTKKSYYEPNIVQNIFKKHKIKNLIKNSYYSKDKIENTKKKSHRPIRIIKGNINTYNLDNRNSSEALINKIINNVNNLPQKSGKINEKLNKNQFFTHYSSAKRIPNGLIAYHQYKNLNRESNFLTNSHFRNSIKLVYKTSSNIFKSNKSLKSPSISEFININNAQRKNQDNKTRKNFQRNFQIKETKLNNIQNLNININNQINIRLNNNLKDLKNITLNNNKNKLSINLKSKNKHKHRNKSIEYNSNINKFSDKI